MIESITLTQHLPLYVINCFLAAGYDTTEVIADMHVTNKAGDSFKTTVCEEESSSFMKQNESKGITMAKQLTLSDQSLALIKKLLEEKSTMSIKKDSQLLNQAGGESYSKRHSNVSVSFKQLYS